MISDLAHIERCEENLILQGWDASDRADHKMMVDSSIGVGHNIALKSTTELNARKAEEMIIGLIGLANSGKTTIFNALTGSEAPVTAYANTKVDPNLAVVAVADERLNRLEAMYDPKKTTHATVDMIDFVGLSEGDAQGGVFSSLTMGLIKNTDALGLVVRNFDDDLAGAPDPVGDMEQIEVELYMSDLIIAERRLEKIELCYKRGQKDRSLEFEEALLRKIFDQLGQDRPILDMDLGDDESKAVKGFHFLTKKPILVIVNSSEENFAKSPDLLERIEKRHRAIEFAGAFEMDLARLDDEEEARLFMDDFGIRESARDRLTRIAYETVGYISFFTVGPDEVRAWNIVKGQSAVDAAGAIHNDLARGFIRAECFSYDDLIDCGSEKGVREKGRFRLEGKNYIVRDGDILSIRFSV